jgi:hypothetical protein
MDPDHPLWAFRPPQPPELLEHDIETSMRPLIASELSGVIMGEGSVTRKWDINIDGVAHYGMLPDFLQDLRVIGFSKEDLSPLFYGAEAYIQMWEKACSLSERGCE